MQQYPFAANHCAQGVWSGFGTNAGKKVRCALNIIVRQSHPVSRRHSEGAVVSLSTPDVETPQVVCIQFNHLKCDKLNITHCANIRIIISSLFLISDMLAIPSV